MQLDIDQRRLRWDHRRRETTRYDRHRARTKRVTLPQIASNMRLPPPGAGLHVRLQREIP